MIFLIILLTIVLVLLILFVSWFITLKASGKCPLCAMKKILMPTKVTMETEKNSDYSTNVAMTPPMGWSSWNTFRQNINEDLIYDTAVAMKKSGLADAGYNFVNLDDCWHSSLRDSMGRLQGDFTNFPNGIPELIKKINDLELKVGLYSSNGTLTCEDLPASLGNEELDAKTIASWGCEFFKYDYCHHKVISGHAPLIEKMVISEEGKAEFLTLKPADAEFTGMAKVMKSKDIPSGEYIGFISFGSGKATFVCNIPEENDYIITFHIFKVPVKNEQYMQVIVNDEVNEMFVSPTKAFSKTGRQQIKVHLKAGNNTIILQNPVQTRADSSYIQYSRMGKELKKATKEWAMFTKSPEKPITYSICEWGVASPWRWGAKAGNMWRTTPDIMPKWFSILAIYDRTIKLYKYSKPGAWNDPDMLEVGNGKLTDDENKTHFTLWCMMAAPLILGNDIRMFIDNNGNPISQNSTLEIVTNQNLINIDQDSMGKSAKRIKHSLKLDILARPLFNGDVALCIFNRGSKKRSVSFDIDSLVKDNYFNWRTEAYNYEVHELWNNERFEGKKIPVFVPKHGVAVYRIKPKHN